MGEFTLATFNANSIRARLAAVLEWTKKQEPDVLCLQECKVQDKDFPFAALEPLGYTALYRGQKSYNGVAVITKHPAEEIRTGLYGGAEEEARFISAKIGGIPVVNVYVPQGVAPGTEKFAYKLRWLKDLLSYLGRHYSPQSPLLVAGDFNVALEPRDVYDPEGLRGEVGFHPDEQSILREYLSWGLVDVLRKHRPDSGLYTFWDYRIPNALKRRMGWRIDYILATPPVAQKCTNVWIDLEARAAEKPSDHTFLVAEFEI
ncbi:MAG: exodeoxyribonuclease III [Deltaproteobacteria bacterium]